MTRHRAFRATHPQPAVSDTVELIEQSLLTALLTNDDERRRTSRDGKRPQPEVLVR